jgi:hypothetical protein
MEKPICNAIDLLHAGKTPWNRIPRVKRWGIKFYHKITRAGGYYYSMPYAVVYVDAPTKLLARLAVTADADTAHAFYDAVRKNPDRITYGTARPGKARR